MLMAVTGSPEEKSTSRRFAVLSAAAVRARGLRWESATIVSLASRLARRLYRGDPLASRVKLSKTDFAAALLTGILARPR